MAGSVCLLWGALELVPQAWLPENQWGSTLAQLARCLAPVCGAQHESRRLGSTSSGWRGRLPPESLLMFSRVQGLRRVLSHVPHPLPQPQEQREVPV